MVQVRGGQESRARGAAARVRACTQAGVVKRWGKGAGSGGELHETEGVCGGEGPRRVCPL